MKKTLLILSAIFLFFAGCKKDDVIEASKVEVKNEVIEEGSNYIKINAEYVYPEEMAAVYLYLSEQENMSDAKVYECKMEGKSFSVEANGLKENKKYHYCYEFDNGYVKKTVYGEQRSFTTLDITMPKVTTNDVTDITISSAKCGGNVTSDGNAAVTARGVCWSTSQNPTIDDNKTTDGSGTGTYTSNISNLTHNTKYYVRAYATNEKGTAYGEQKEFTTMVNESMPVVTTNEITGITQTTATSGGNVTSDGNAAVTARGVCWSTSQNPTIDDNKTTDGNGAGSFTSSITGLTANTTYYVRAYATNEKGTSYGEQKSFKTLQNIELPTVTTTNVSNITQTTATSGGNVTSDGGATITARGVCWSTSQNPTIDDNKTTDGNGTGSFTSNMTGLTANTTYYVRAYATNEKGTAYGEQRSFTTIQVFDETIDPNGNRIITLYGDVVFTMIAVEGGTFQMGATSEQGSDAESIEYPVHSVTLSDYYIGETEVTQELWEAVMGSNPSSFSGNPQRPVEYVSWNDCKEFIEKLNDLTGKNFRLPTEAEWEYAARGGNESQGYKYSGSNTIGNVAWYMDNSGSETHNVKTKSPNELGIYDMSGNVWELCEDWYGDYSSGSQTNPTGPSSGSGRVYRGGGWGSVAGFCRVSFRYDCNPDDRNYSLGLRLCLSQY